MLDKLAMNTWNRVSAQEVASALGSPAVRVQRTKYHDAVYTFDRPGAAKTSPILTLHTEPVRLSIAPTKLELNPSRFHNFSELNSMLSSFTDVSKLQITRTDYAVDVPQSIETIRASLVLSRKKTREVYKRGHTLTGFYLGMRPELLSVYEKTTVGERQLSRVELRQWTKKVLIPEYTSISEIRNAKPFKNVRFKSLSENAAEIDRGKASGWNRLVAEHGAQGAIKILNKYSNFSRDFGHLIEPDPTMPNLDELFQHSIAAYFTESGTNTSDLAGGPQ